jgi:hypothetical protein
LVLAGRFEQEETESAELGGGLASPHLRSLCFFLLFKKPAAPEGGWAEIWGYQ